MTRNTLHAKHKWQRFLKKKRKRSMSSLTQNQYKTVSTRGIHTFKHMYKAIFSLSLFQLSTLKGLYLAGLFLRLQPIFYSIFFYHFFNKSPTYFSNHSPFFKGSTFWQVLTSLLLFLHPTAYSPSNFATIIFFSTYISVANATIAMKIPNFILSEKEPKQLL